MILKEIEENMLKNSSEVPGDHMKGEGKNHKNDQNHTGDSGLLIHPLGRDTSIQCLVRLSRFDYFSIAALNRSFRSLIRSGELYQIRQKMGIIEQWIYFSCDVFKWEAFDPNHGRLMHLPKMNSNECFMLSDKESLGVGTELLVFGREIMGPAIYKYSILTNSWLQGMKMNTPRCLFGSASLKEIAILAGGCDQYGNILSSVELYNSNTGTWEILPDLNTARKMCSGVFMDDKFYVLGGVGVGKTTQLTCGEEFDLKTRKWRKIPNMCPPRNGGDGVTETPASGEAPPLVAVVNNVLYAADYASQEIKRYVKEINSWVTIGRLPERVTSVKGWGVAFRACGDKLVVIGGPSLHGETVTEVNAWVVDEGAPQWNSLVIIQSGCFVYNCAVVGC
ncbi:F-box/kelch-repeat protein At1g26930-like [Cicer arietinum]|uniref:F-box/kelch-repeat protein SKIP11-like n=1 Tax=Cicer arietinum TaxID=3827 RepID=A0A1S2YRL8_CICAR|nr:F-box/kelch-repeat protein SKIP11-like [Cicer arietinum]